MGNGTSSGKGTAQTVGGSKLTTSQKIDQSQFYQAGIAQRIDVNGVGMASFRMTNSKTGVTTVHISTRLEGETQTTRTQIDMNTTGGVAQMMRKAEKAARDALKKRAKNK